MKEAFNRISNIESDYLDADMMGEQIIFKNVPDTPNSFSEILVFSKKQGFKILQDGSRGCYISPAVEERFEEIK